MAEESKDCLRQMESLVPRRTVDSWTVPDRIVSVQGLAEYTLHKAANFNEDVKLLKSAGIYLF